MGRIYREPKLKLRRGGRGRLRAGKRPDRYGLSSVGGGGGDAHLSVRLWGKLWISTPFRQLDIYFFI